MVKYGNTRPGNQLCDERTSLLEGLFNLFSSYCYNLCFFQIAISGPSDQCSNIVPVHNNFTERMS